MSSVLTELPVVGGAVAILDKALGDMGLTPFVSGTLEFIVVLTVLVTVGTFVVTKVAPLLVSALVGPLVALVKTLHVVLLLPQLAFTTGGRHPSRLVYAYGVGVERASESITTGLREVPRKLDPVRRVPKKAVLLVVLGLFLLWNWSYCPEGDAGCVSPISQWTAAAEAWATSSG